MLECLTCEIQRLLSKIQSYLRSKYVFFLLYDAKNFLEFYLALYVWFTLVKPIIIIRKPVFFLLKTKAVHICFEKNKPRNKKQVYFYVLHKKSIILLKNDAMCLCDSVYYKCLFSFRWYNENTKKEHEILLKNS